MTRTPLSTLVAVVALVGLCSALALGAGTALAQDSPRGNNTHDSIQDAREAADFAFGTPSYVPSDVPFDYASVQHGQIPIVRLFWNTDDRTKRLSVHANPRAENVNLFRGNSQREGTENISINGQPGDYQQPSTPNGTPTVTLVSANDTVYLVTGTYNRSTLIRVAESIGTVQPQATSNTTTGNTTALANTLTIKSTGEERVFYNVTASEGMKPAAGADLTGADSPDTVNGNRASGSTAQGGRDNFTFAGEITALTLNGGPARVLVNGEEVNPDSYSTATPTSTSAPTPTPTATPTPTPSSTATETATAASTPTAISMLTETTIASSAATRSVSTTTNETTSGGQILSPEAGGGAETESSGSGPGFGVLAAALALLGAGFVLRRWRP